MAIDPLAEDLVTMREATKLYPKNGNGKPPHVSQVYRHSSAGLRGITLEWLQCGATRCTSRQAIARFFRKLTAAARGEAMPTAPTELPDAKARRVETELDALRI